MKKLLNAVGLLDPARGLKRKMEAAFQPAQYALASLRCRWTGVAGGLPVPPPRLTFLVSGHTDVFTSLSNGKRGAESIRSTLAKHQVRLEDLPAVLDFGCGSGRVLRNWKDLKPTQIFATDYNPELVQWCQATFPFARVGQNNAAPPLDYEDGQFSLIYALSIFTHLDEELQRPWLLELHRVLRPGGYLLVSLHGNTSVSRSLTAAEQKRFAEGQLVIRRPELSGENACAVYHPSAYVREVFAPPFAVLDHIPEGAKGNPPQDYYLLQKKTV